MTREPAFLHQVELVLAFDGRQFRNVMKWFSGMVAARTRLVGLR